MATYSRRLADSWPQMHWLLMKKWLLLLQQPFEPHYSVGQSFRSVAAPMWRILWAGANAKISQRWAAVKEIRLHLLLISEWLVFLSFFCTQICTLIHTHGALGLSLVLANNKIIKQKWFFFPSCYFCSQQNRKKINCRRLFFRYHKGEVKYILKMTSKHSRSNQIIAIWL